MKYTLVSVCWPARMRKQMLENHVCDMILSPRGHDLDKATQIRHTSLTHGYPTLKEPKGTSRQTNKHFKFTGVNGISNDWWMHNQ
jgi:hypothetical protein